MPTDYGFTGLHADAATGLDYYNARYYDPLAGQFASADSILPGDGFDIFGLSSLRLREGNPEARTDPSGNAWIPHGKRANPNDPFLRGAEGFGAGLIDAFTGTVTDLWNAATHPVETGRGLLLLSLRVAIEGPVPVAISIGQTAARSVWSGLTSSDPYTRGHTVGMVVGNIVLGVVGTKGLGYVAGLARAGVAVRAAEESPYVVRGGVVGNIAKLPVDQEGLLNGVSVNTGKGMSVAELASYPPVPKYGQIGVTTQKQVIARGGVIELRPLDDNPFHAEISGIGPQDLIDILLQMVNPSRQ